MKGMFNQNELLTLQMSCDLFGVLTYASNLNISIILIRTNHKTESQEVTCMLLLYELVCS